MNELDKLFNKLKEEKLKEKEKILHGAQEKRKEILKDIEKEAEDYFNNLFEESKERLIAQEKENLFKEELKMRKEILERKERIIQVALEKVKNFLEKNPHLIPEKEIVCRKERIKEKLNIEEFLNFLKEKYNKEIKKILDEVGV